MKNLKMKGMLWYKGNRIVHYQGSEGFYIGALKFKSIQAAKCAITKFQNKNK